MNALASIRADMESGIVYDFQSTETNVNDIIHVAGFLRREHIVFADPATAARAISLENIYRRRLLGIARSTGLLCPQCYRKQNFGAIGGLLAAWPPSGRVCCSRS